MFYGLRTDYLSERAAIINGRSWKRQMQKALRENEPEKLSNLVHAAESALFIRWQELRKNESPEERVSMQAAVDNLLAIKIHKLGWPDPRG